MSEVFELSQNQLMRNNSFEFSYKSDVNIKNIFLHSHDFYELYFFIGGKATYSVDNIYYNLVPGDILLISPNYLHQLEVKDVNFSYERMVLWINPKFLKKLSSKETNLAFCFEKCSEIKSYLLRDFNLSEKIRKFLLQLEKNSEKFGSDIEKEILIRQILLEINRYFYIEDFDEKAINARYAKHNSEIVSKAIFYIEENLTKNLSLDEISKEIFVSKFYLSRLFKDEIKISIHKFILKKRLLLSKKMLEEKIPIKEFYEKCGFKDESSFFRAFKTEFGITPKKYSSLVSKEEN